MGYVLSAIGIIILVICFFAALTLFSNNMNSVATFFLFFVIIGAILGLMAVRKGDRL